VAKHVVRGAHMHTLSFALHELGHLCMARYLDYQLCYGGSGVHGCCVSEAYSTEGSYHRLGWARICSWHMRARRLHNNYSRII